MDFSKAFNKRTTVRFHQDLFRINNMKSKISLPSTFSTEIENQRLLAPDFIFNQTWRQIALEVEGRIRRKLWLSRTISSRNHRNAADLTTKVFFSFIAAETFFSWMKNSFDREWNAFVSIVGSLRDASKDDKKALKVTRALELWKVLNSIQSLKSLQSLQSFQSHDSPVSLEGLERHKGALRALRASRVLRALTSLTALRALKA